MGFNSGFKGLRYFPISYIEGLRKSKEEPQSGSLVYVDFKTLGHPNKTQC